IQGALKPAVPYTEITLRSIDPDGIISDRTFTVDAVGQYLRREAYFTKNGIWKFRAYFAGNEETIGTESDDLVVPVGIDIGRAIILGGGEAAQSNTYWDVTKKLTVAAYRDFKSKGYLKEMIYYLINSQSVDINYDDISDDVVNVTTPSVAAFLDAIRTRYATVLDTQTPLFIYMQGHATQDKRFKILGTEEYLTSLQMKDALDKLQGVGAYQGQGGVESNIIVIIETCYSGNFIADLSGPRRVIVTSAGNEPYNTDATGQISFSRRLFSKLLEGESLKKAFDYARSAQVNMNYPAPRLDDNGDGTDNSTDGLLASNIHLNGALTWGLKPVIGTGAVSMAAVIEGVASTPISVNVTKGDVNIDRVWTQIIAPNANIGGGTETIAYPEIALTLNTVSQRYEGTLTGLTVSGIYKIVVLARDVNKDVSDPVLAYITVASPPPPEGDVNGDGDVTLADAILALKVLGKIAPPLGTPGGVRADYETSGADVNGDRKIGMEEVIFILQKAGGVR
ncbi:MAG: dockerin type I domain-containing protein, partial [Deltaproteobacteria bacterium]